MAPFTIAYPAPPGKSTLRFGELKGAIPGITQAVLSLQLQELVADGIISKHEYAEVPPRTEYSLTDLGRTLIPVITAMEQWGIQYLLDHRKEHGDCLWVKRGAERIGYSSTLVNQQSPLYFRLQQSVIQLRLGFLLSATLQYRIKDLLFKVKHMKKILFLICMALSVACLGQTHKPRIFLFVPGAWDGGWDYAQVDSLFTAKGHVVYRPTLTGLGERVHLSNTDINLSTYITDIVNVIKFENLYEIILVGHSYGGMVISGVAEQIPERISQLVYLDAMVPNDGESAQAVCGELWNILMKPHVKDGYVLYPFGTTASAPPSDVPQPLKTFTEPLRITNALVKKIPTAFILMTKDGKSNSATDKMGIVRARARNWKIYTLEGGHYAMREQPQNLVRELELVLRDTGSMDK